MRGYPSANFVGRQIINVNLEYQFPIGDLFFGKNLLPIFFKDLYGTLFLDAVAVDGGAFDPSVGKYRVTKLNKQFFSTGVELKLNSSIAYYIPITYIFGAYYGFDQQYQGGFYPFLGIGVGRTHGIDKATPTHSNYQQQRPW